MKLRNISVAASVLITSIVSISTPYALEAPGPTKIKKVYVSNGDNFHLRVFADSSDPNYWYCNNGPKGEDAWAYINQNDSGFPTKMAVLLHSFSKGHEIKVYTEGVDHAAGHMCHIVEIEVLPVP